MLMIFQDPQTTTIGCVLIYRLRTDRNFTDKQFAPQRVLSTFGKNCRNVSIRRRTVFPNVPYNPTQSGFVATRCFDKSNGSNLPSSDLSIRCFPTPKLRTKNKHVRLSQFRQMDIFCHTAIFATMTLSFRTDRLYISHYVSRIGFGPFFYGGQIIIWIADSIDLYLDGYV